MPAQKLLSQKDLKKVPQFISEGTSLAAYGTTPVNPNFTAAGQRSMLTPAYEPEWVDKDFGGNIDRQGIIKVREKNTLTYKGRLMEDDIDLIKWAMNKPVGGNTPQQSRTWMDSWSNNAGTETYRVFRGCKVISSSITTTPNDVVMLEIQMNVKQAIESTTNPITLGTGSFADEETGTPIRFKDLGDFYYGANNVNFRNSTVTTTYTLRKQDSNGSETDLYVDHSLRRITGSVDIFKSNANFNEDARAGTQKRGYMTIHKKGTDGVASRRSPTSGGNYVKIEAVIPGAWGNGIDVQIAKGASSLNIVTNGLFVKINALTSSSLQSVRDAINNDPEASLLIKATKVGGSNSTIIDALGKAKLAGGSDANSKLIFNRFRWLPTSEDLIDQTEATMESKSFEADEIEVFKAA